MKIFESINILNRCKKYKLESIWQCPDFLFVIFGIIIISVIIAVSLFGYIYSNPEVAAVAAPLIVPPLLIIAYAITKSFEYLAAASEMKSEFISIMSHQLRSPLVSVKWRVEAYLAKQNSLESNAEEKEIIGAIFKENEEMLAIINKFLELKKIEEGKFILNKRKFDVLKLLQETIEFKRKLPANSVRIKQNSPFIVNADQDKIKFVIENILDNALRYSSAIKDVEIYAENSEGYVKISVKDRGLGISEENTKHIFQKFARPEESVRNQIPGLGIGLYLSKKIIEKHLGKIGFQSQKGEGSTFWFSLPV